MNESHDQNVLIFYEQLDVEATYAVVGGDVLDGSIDDQVSDDI